MINSLACTGRRSRARRGRRTTHTHELAKGVCGPLARAAVTRGILWCLSTPAARAGFEQTRGHGGPRHVRRQCSAHAHTFGDRAVDRAFVSLTRSLPCAAACEQSSQVRSSIGVARGQGRAVKRGCAAARARSDDESLWRRGRDYDHGCVWGGIGRKSRSVWSVGLVGRSQVG